MVCLLLVDKIGVKVSLKRLMHMHFLCNMSGLQAFLMEND